MMISLDKDKERLLRRLARRRYGNRHGALSAIVVEGLQELEKKEEKTTQSRLLEILEKGFDLGLKSSKIYDSRDELYDR